MSSQWVKCTSDDGEKDIFVNLAIAGTIESRKRGTRIEFPGDAEYFVEVKESPEEIMKLLSEIKNTARP